MLPADLPNVEIALVECLRVFARRGRNLRREQESEAVKIEPLAGEMVMVEQPNSISQEVQQ